MQKNDQGRIVFVSGSFNVLHPGHLRLFRFAKECGDYLIVGVLSDRLANNAAHVPEQLRLECVRAHSWVDEAFLVDEPIVNIIRRIRPNFIVKGKEHETRFNPEIDALNDYGGRLLFSSGESVFSSLDLLRKEFYQSELRPISLPHDYMGRHGITLERLRDLVNRFAQLNVCVLGDLIIDEYITCQPLGMSQEDPTIVVTPIDSTRFVGGAGIVAGHGAGLGASVTFISLTGNDQSRLYALESLESQSIQTHLLLDESRPTTLKQRFRSKGKSLLRVSYLHQDSINIELQSQLIKIISEIIQDINLLVFSDFNYGCLPQNIVDEIIELAKKNNVMLVADSQCSSQVGDVGRFKSMELLTPTEFEARTSLKDNESGLVILAEKLRQKSSANNILLKLGEEGLLIHANHSPDSSWLTDRISALNTSPKDVAGAGDSLLITSALTLASQGTIWEAACLGSLAAAIQVGRVGNTPISVHEMIEELS